MLLRGAPLQETTVIQTSLVLQPLPLQQLQATLQQLRVFTGLYSNAPQDLSPHLEGRQRKKYRSRKAEEQGEAVQSLSNAVLFKAAAVDPVALLTLPHVNVTSALADMQALLQGSRLQSLKALFDGDEQLAAKTVAALLSQPLSLRLMQADEQQQAAEAAAAEPAADVSLTVGTGFFVPGSISSDAETPTARAVNGAPAPTPPPRGPAAAAFAAAAAVPPPPPPPRVPAAAAADAAAAGGAVPAPPSQAQNAGEGDDDATSSSSRAEIVLLPASQLSPEQLSELLWSLLDNCHFTLQHQQQHLQHEQRRIQDQQQLEELMMQTGMDPEAAREAAQQAAAERAAQQQSEEGGGGPPGLGPAAAAAQEARWWRKKQLPSVFGASSEEAAVQLHAVSATAGHLVEQLAGTVRVAKGTRPCNPACSSSACNMMPSCLCLQRCCCERHL